MPRMLLTVLGLVLVAGCGAPAAAPPAPAGTTPPSIPGTTPPSAPPGGIALTGELKTPATLTPQQLAALPQQSVQVSFASSKGTEQHAEAGVPLAAIIPAGALRTTSRKNDLLAFAVLAVGSDGYAAAVAYGEVSADFGNRGALVALTEDGKPLARPRLVVPGDVKGGRYVSDLLELRVVRVG